MREALSSQLRNVELKARVSNLSAARDVAKEIATQRLPAQRQVDTYFRCPRGRLKLREIDHRQAQLIWYDRPDQHSAKGSDYLIVDVADAATMKGALEAAFAIAVIVAKRREILLFENVRIHLDDVARLGSFIEFEAVLTPDCDEATGRRKVDFLQATFGVQPCDLIAGSYADMMVTASFAAPR